MKRIVQLVIAAALAAIPAADAYAGSSCFDACTGPQGQEPCGATFLGCPPGGGQCIQCRDDNDCQPGGNCSNSMCINLPCNPDAGGMPPNDAGEVDSGGGAGDTGVADSGIVGPPVDASVRDASTSTRADAGGGGGGGGGGPGTSDRSGCDCNTMPRETAAFGVLILLLFAQLRRRGDRNSH